MQDVVVKLEDLKKARDYKKVNDSIYAYKSYWYDISFIKNIPLYTNRQKIKGFPLFYILEVKYKIVNDTMEFEKVYYQGKKVFSQDNYSNPMYSIKNIKKEFFNCKNIKEVRAFLNIFKVLAKEFQLKQEV